MKLILEPTGTVETVNSTPARLWTGETDSGIAVTCWIAIVQVRADADHQALERELKQIKVTREFVAFDMRFML